MIAAVYENNGNIVKTLKAGARTDNGKTIWLEQGLTKSEAVPTGKKASGWMHIEEERIGCGAYDDLSKNQFAAAFDPSGTNYQDAASIQNLIIDCAKTGVPHPNPAKNMIYMKVTDTKAIGVAVSKNGYIITAFPESVSKLPFL